MSDHIDSWDVDTDRIRKRLEERGPTEETILILCAALEDLRSWNTSLSGRLMAQIEALSKEMVVQRRANADLLRQLGETESALAKNAAQTKALAELTADLVVQRDEAQALAESPHLP